MSEKLSEDPVAVMLRLKGVGDIVDLKIEKIFCVDIWMCWVFVKNGCTVDKEL